MSSQPIPVETERAPFVPTTTPSIDRANRLLGVRAHPGFADLIRISQDMVQTAVDQCTDFPGWDAQQIVVLKVRMQAAKEHHVAWLAKINETIEAGVAEARAQMSEGVAPPKSAADAVDQGDFVRQRVLQNFEEMESRIAGSYEAKPDDPNPYSFES